MPTLWSPGPHVEDLIMAAFPASNSTGRCTGARDFRCLIRCSDGYFAGWRKLIDRRHSWRYKSIEIHRRPLLRGYLPSEHLGWGGECAGSAWSHPFGSPVIASVSWGSSLIFLHLGVGQGLETINQMKIHWFLNFLVLWIIIGVLIVDSLFAIILNSIYI